jgi:hypothetical protein
MATFLLFIFSMLALFDAIYFHYGKEQLHATPGSRREHWLHIAIGVGFWGTIYCWYWRLVPDWGIFFLALQWGPFTVDMFTERWTRRPQGGLSFAERVLHLSGYATLLLSNFLALRQGPAATPESHFGVGVLMCGVVLFTMWQLSLIFWKNTKVNPES